MGVDGVGADEAEGAEEGESGAQLRRNGGDEKTRAANDGFGEVGGGDRDFLEEKVEDGENERAGIRGEEDGMHVEDAAEGRTRDADGGEKVLDGEKRRERRRTERRVEAESFVSINVEILEVKKFPTEEEAGVGGCGERK